MVKNDIEIKIVTELPIVYTFVSHLLSFEISTTNIYSLVWSNKHSKMKSKAGMIDFIYVYI